MSELTCPSCGQRLDRPTRYCPECGARLPDPPAVAPEPPPPAEPSRDGPPSPRAEGEAPLADLSAPAEGEAPLADPPLPVDQPAAAPAPSATLVLPPLEAPLPVMPTAPPPSAKEPQDSLAPGIGAPPPVEAPLSAMPPPSTEEPGAAPLAAAGEPLPTEVPLPAPPPARSLPTGGPPPPYPLPGTVAPASNRRALWWLAGGLGCLALVFFGACASIGLLTLLGQRVGERDTRGATAVPRDESDTARGGATSASGELLLEDDFSDEMASDLDVSEDETSRSAYEDGVYVVEVKVPEMVVWSLVGGPYADVSVEVEAEVPPGSDVTAAGIIFHYQDGDNFYLYSVSSDGYYQLELLQDGEWIMLIDPTLSDAVEDGWNTLRVETRGSRIALYANGELLEQTADTTFSTGDAGLAVSTFEGSTGMVRFDNLVVVRAE